MAGAESASTPRITQGAILFRIIVSPLLTRRGAFAAAASIRFRGSDVKQFTQHEARKQEPEREPPRRADPLDCCNASGFEQRSGGQEVFEQDIWTSRGFALR